MRIKNSFLFVAILFLMIVLVIGCEKVIQIELGEAEQMIVVNSVINPDSLILVNLSRNRHILDNAEIPSMEEPKYHPIIKLYANENYIEDLVAVIGGDYISTIKPVIGVNYSLQIAEPKYNAAFAEALIPEPVPIRRVDTSTLVQSSGNDYYWGDYGSKLNCKIAIDDPINQKNYYMLKFEVDKSYWQIRDTSYMVVDSVFLNEKWIYDFREVTYYEKYARYSDNNVNYVSNDISAQFVVGNAYVFSDALFDGNVYEFSANIFVYNLYSLDSAIVGVNLLSLSEEYYKYLKTRELHYGSKDDFFNSPVPVYNNIDGGVGVFGAYSSSKSMFTLKLLNPYDEYYYK
jgi:hypothetical protein